MNGPVGDKERLLHIRDAIRNILEFTKGFNQESYLKNLLVQSAVERQFEIIGEAVAHVSEELKESYPKTEWYKIRAFRNFISHEYFGVSSKQIWNVVEVNLSELKIQIDNIILEKRFE